MSIFLSVIMPAYNGERYIAAALESIQQQLPPQAEVLLVDDGSTDRTLEIVRSYAQKLPLRVICQGRTGNWVAATNVGLREADGEWACFLHQDDLWLPQRMERLLPAMRSAPGTLVVHDSIFVDANGRTVGPWTCPLPRGDVSPELWAERLLVQNFIALPAPVFRRNAALESGALDESLWFSADWDLWLRLGIGSSVRIIREPLTAFRIHSLSQTASRSLAPGEWAQQLTTVLERYLPRLSLPDRALQQVRSAATASIAINSALSAVSRGEIVNPFPTLGQFLSLGPSGWHRYFRDSRIVQRFGSRCRAFQRST